MTIERLEAADIGLENPIFLLRRDPSIGRCRIGAVTYLVTRRLSDSEHLRDGSQAGCQHMVEYIQSRPSVFGKCRYFLFGFSSWNQPGAIARKRLLWGAPELTAVSQEALQLGPQVPIVDTEKKLIVAGVLEFSIERLFPMAEAVRTEAQGTLRCAILVSEGKSILETDVVRELYENTNDGESRLDWHRCLQFCCCVKRYKVIRAFGGFDDREVAVDLFTG